MVTEGCNPQTNAIRARAKIFHSMSTDSGHTMGILGRENGLYNDSIVDIWRICTKNQHTQFVAEENEQFIQAQLGLLNEDVYDDDTDIYDK